jgi:hypothetical protein
MRNGHSPYSPQGWKLEGSTEKSNWTTISEVRDCQGFRELNQETSFSCQTFQFFSFLRLTQTQENKATVYSYPPSPHIFVLNLVEFPGKIISRE